MVKTVFSAAVSTVQQVAVYAVTLPVRVLNAVDAAIKELAGL